MTNPTNVPLSGYDPSTLVIASGPGWIALDKPAGVSVHNDPEKKADSLAFGHQILTRDPRLATDTKWDGGALFPVHRLDRETSGVLVLATNKEAASRLQTAIAERRARKIYRAILRGVAGSGGEEGKWTLPLGEKAEGRRNPAGPPGTRKPCETRFHVLRATRHLTEIEVELLTGRQHQIRRHAVLSKHEVLGDHRYGDPKYIGKLEGIYGGELRLMLHAHSIEIEAKSAVRATAPLPVAFENLFSGTP